MNQNGITYTAQIVIPTLPSIVGRISKLVEDPDCGMAEVGAAIAEDPALTATVLATVNTSLFGLSVPCRTAQQACTMLGLRRVHDLVIHASVLNSFQHLADSGFDVASTWQRAPIVAYAAAQIARQMGGPGELDEDDAYLAGLMHDVGEIVLLDMFREHYAALRNDARRSGENLLAVEQREMACSHAEIGASAVEAWGLGAAVKAAVAGHHAHVRSGVPALTAAVAAGVRIVDVLLERPPKNDTAIFDASFAEALGVPHVQLAAIIEHTRQRAAPSV